MSESADKFKGHIAKALPFSKVSLSSNGRRAGKVVSAVKTDIGVVFYLEVDHLGIGATSNNLGGISIEIPLYNILLPGQSRICPSESGWYRVLLSDGKNIEAWYEAGKAQWRVNGKVIGTMHEIFVDGWAFPAIVVGIEKLGDIDPTQSHLIEAIEKIVDSVTTQEPDFAG